jgi:[ribosomal protein S5]-alanine N-acetyltransferase
MTIQLPDRIRTQRLILREPRNTDAPVLFDTYTQDAVVARYMVWRPHTQLSETAGFVERCMQGWASGQGRPYVLAFHDSEHLPLGMLEARLQPHTIDIGYVLGRQHWGAGLMPEAIMALSELALALPDCFRIQATCDVENLASARTLEKSGFVREGKLARYAIHPNRSAEPSACFMYARCRN